MRIPCLLLLMLTACAPEPTAESVIERALLAHGSAGLEGRKLRMNFRGRIYTAKLNEGRYHYTKSPLYPDSNLVGVDVLTNDGFTRFVADTVMTLTDKQRAAYRSSINSVVYFARLPYGLEDPAVNAELLGKVTIRHKAYHKVRVTFDEAGGGEDFEDVFLYYFRTDDGGADPAVLTGQAAGAMDYLAYTYAEEDGLGVRFREAYNRRTVDGVVFQDYVNYRADPTIDFARIEELFAAGELTELSRIETEVVGFE